MRASSATGLWYTARQVSGDSSRKMARMSGCQDHHKFRDSSRSLRTTSLVFESLMGSPTGNGPPPAAGVAAKGRKTEAGHPLAREG